MDYVKLITDTYPKIAEELVNHSQSNNALSDSLENVARNIWQLGQLWLTFLDGADFGLTVDRQIYDQIAQFARKTHDSIEDEATQWMMMTARTMKTWEIRLGLKCAVESVGTVLIFNGNFDDTLRMLIDARNRENPSLSDS